MTSETVYSVELVSRMTYPEREFLTGHLYGHPAPKRAVDPSNDGGVSVQRPACEPLARPSISPAWRSLTKLFSATT